MISLCDNSFCTPPTGLKPKITEQRESLLSKYRGWNGYIYDDDKCGYSGTDKNKLKITSMSGKLQGTYQCVVSNDVDSVKSDEILLTMEKEQSKLGIIILLCMITMINHSNNIIILLL